MRGYEFTRLSVEHQHAWQVDWRDRLLSLIDFRLRFEAGQTGLGIACVLFSFGFSFHFDLSPLWSATLSLHGLGADIDISSGNFYTGLGDIDDDLEDMGLLPAPLTPEVQELGERAADALLGDGFERDILALAICPEHGAIQNCGDAHNEAAGLDAEEHVCEDPCPDGERVRVERPVTVEEIATTACAEDDCEGIPALPVEEPLTPCSKHRQLCPPRC